MKVESCQRLNVVCASRRLQARSVHDSVFYLGIARGADFHRRGAFYLTLVPIRPRRRGERRSLRTFRRRVSPPRVPRFQSPPSAPFNSASDAFQLHPDVRSLWNDPQCRRNRVAPYNTFYEELDAHLRRAGLSGKQCDAWDRPVVIASGVGGGGGGASGSGPGSSGGSGGGGSRGGSNESSVVDLLPAEKFAPFIVPFRGGDGDGDGDGGSSSSSSSTQANPFSVPEAYVRALDQKVRSVASLRAAMRDAGLDDDQKRELQATIQAYFKEWLLTSGSMRQVYDLARIERGE